MKAERMPKSQQNVFGEPIELCCEDPLTGFYRDGHCNTGPNDLGTHTVCAFDDRGVSRIFSVCG